MVYSFSLVVVVVVVVVVLLNIHWVLRVRQTNWHRRSHVGVVLTSTICLCSCVLFYSSFTVIFICTITNLTYKTVYLPN